VRLLARPKRDNPGDASVGRGRNPDIARIDALGPDFEGRARQGQECCVLAPDRLRADAQLRKLGRFLKACRSNAGDRRSSDWLDPFHDTQPSRRRGFLGHGMVSCRADPAWMIESYR